MSANSETITLNDPKQDVEKNVNDAASHAPASALTKDSESPSDPHLVQLEPADDPKCLSLWHKWLTVLAISSSSLCATFASSVVRSLLYFAFLHGAKRSARAGTNSRRSVTDARWATTHTGILHRGRPRARPAHDT